MTRTVIESKTKTVIIGFDEPFCVIGERINPTGRKKLAAEMEAGNFETVLKDALEQVACGANILDVNSGAVFTNKRPIEKKPRQISNALNRETDSTLAQPGMAYGVKSLMPMMVTNSSRKMIAR